MQLSQTMRIREPALTTGIPYAVNASPQTSTPEFFRKDGKIGDEKLHGGAKPLSPVQIKKFTEEQGKQNEQRIKAERDRERNDRIDVKYEATFFIALASKAHICSRLLTHALPNMLHEFWQLGNIPVASFAPALLQWPEPKEGKEYSYDEIKAHGAKHPRKFNEKLLAALLITLHMEPRDADRLAKYFHVDPKKLRQKAAAAVKEEDAAAEKPRAKGQKPKAGV